MKLRKGNRASGNRRSKVSVWERVRTAARSAWKLLAVEALIGAVLIAVFGFGLRAPSSLKEVLAAVWQMIWRR